MRKILWLVVPALVVGYLWLRGDDDDNKKGATVDRVDSSAAVSWHNRFWIDEIPTSERDKINYFISVDDPQIGLFQRTSFYEGDYTVFAWRAQKEGVIEIEMLQTEKKHKLKLQVSDKDCGRFDFCMTVKGAPRGAKKYYSMKDWIIEGNQSPADIAARANDLVSAQIE